MPGVERFDFTAAHGAEGESALLPLPPLTLHYEDRSTDVQGLLDTGATINVLPYRVGIELGAVWRQDATSLRLGGNLAQHEAQPLILSAQVGTSPIVRLAFAWTRTDEVPLILGQINFFMEFDVCFYRSRRTFEVQPKS